MASPQKLMEWEDGSLRKSEAGSFALTWNDAEVGAFASLGEALAELVMLDDGYTGPVTYEVPREQVWEAADAVDLDEVFPLSPNGWVNHFGAWIPGAFLPEHDGPDESFGCLGKFGDMGVSVSVVQWEQAFLMRWHGPERMGETFDVVFYEDPDDALLAAEMKADELMEDWNLKYDDLIGLGNLAFADRFPTPAGAKNLGFVHSYLAYDGAGAGWVDVFYWDDGGTAPFLVVSGETVVGRYSSLDELGDDVDPGDAYASEIDVCDPDDVD